MPATTTNTPLHPPHRQRCIIRGYASGVHFGTLIAQDGRQVELQAARRPSAECVQR